MLEFGHKQVEGECWNLGSYTDHFGAAGYGIDMGQILYRKPRWCVEVAWDFSPTLLT
jgi:hypothetical protein